MNVPVRVLQRNRTNRIHMDMCERRCDTGMAPTVVGTEKFSNLPSVSWRTRAASCIIRLKSEGLRNADGEYGGGSTDTSSRI